MRGHTQLRVALWELRTVQGASAAWFRRNDSVVISYKFGGTMDFCFHGLRITFGFSEGALWSLLK